MSNCVLIIGESGTGKSSSIEHLDPKETFIISALNKMLPFRGAKSNYTPVTGWDDKENNSFVSDDWERVIKMIRVVDKERPDIKVLVVDDLQYVLCREFLDRSSEKGYDKYAEMAKHYWQIIMTAISSRDDLTVFFLSHSDLDAQGKSRVKTIGKMLDEKITVEGLFNVVLHSDVDSGRYYFVTQNTGNTTAKSPKGMFDGLEIENNLALVHEAMINY